MSALGRTINKTDGSYDVDTYTVVLFLFKKTEKSCEIGKVSGIKAGVVCHNIVMKNQVSKYRSQ